MERPKAKAETLASYLRGGDRHLRRANNRHPDILDPAEALVVSFERDRTVLVTNTIGLYRAQAAAILASLLPHDPVRLDALTARIEVALHSRRGKPKNPRTASRKRKQVPRDEIIRLIEALAHKVWADPSDRAPAMLALAIFVHSRIGHRPIEGRGARLEGPWLIVCNAKFNAERAAAPERRIDLSHMSPLVRRALEAYIHLRAEMIAQYGDYDGWYRAASERLARLCEDIGVERIAMTSLRHVALATWKRAGLAPWIIAALAGHASDRSANRYYAAARSGWALEGLPKAEIAHVLLLEARDRLRVERRADAKARVRPSDDLPTDAVADVPPASTSQRDVGSHGGALWADYATRQHHQVARMLTGIRAESGPTTIAPSVARTTRPGSTVQIDPESASQHEESGRRTLTP